MDIILMIIGFVMILGGANYMTDGAASIARRFGVSDFIVGLTIISIGTSAPELVVSIIAAVDGAPSMSIGNIVGSNIFNVLMIIGVVAMIKPINVPVKVLIGDAFWMFLSAAALFVIGLAPELGAGPRILTRVGGLLLLLFFALFMKGTIQGARQPDQTDTSSAASVKIMKTWLSLLCLFGGLATLVIGGQWFVDGATGIARSIGWSEGLIGLTILAVGTSLPEMAASVTAAIKGQSGLSIGTVIGSCIFNVFFVLGLAGSITPLAFGNIGIVDLGVMLGSAIMFIFMGFFYGHRVIKRLEGAIMIVAYFCYMSYLYLGLTI